MTAGLYARLIGAGTPLLLAGAINAAVPLLGLAFLSAGEYVIWTLAATAATFALVFDFGAQAMTTRAAATNAFDGPAARRLVLLGVASPMVVGIAAITAWPVYSASLGERDTSLLAEEAVLALVTVGSMLRGASAVVAAALLGQRRNKDRAWLLMSGAIAQAGVCFLALSAGLGTLALGVGLLGGGIAQGALILIGPYRPSLDAALDSPVIDFGSFARAKGLVTLIGLVVTQLDRWVVAIVASPEQLRLYDVASRLAIIPKVALIALGSGLIAEAARTPPRRDLRDLNRRISGLNAGLAFLGGLASFAITLLVAGAAGILQGDWVLWVVVPISAHFAHSCTISVNMLLVGAGQANIELRFAALLGAFVSVAYAAGLLFDSASVAVLGWGAGVIVACVINVWLAPRAAWDFS